MKGDKKRLYSDKFCMLLSLVTIETYQEGGDSVGRKNGKRREGRQEVRDTTQARPGGTA